MDEIIIKFGQIAGIGGLALGTFLVLSRDLLKKLKVPGLKQDQWFKIVIIFMLLVWIIALAGLASWVFHPTAKKDTFSTLKQINDQLVFLEGRLGQIDQNLNKITLAIQTLQTLQKSSDEVEVIHAELALEVEKEFGFTGSLFNETKGTVDSLQKELNKFSSWAVQNTSEVDPEVSSWLNKVVANFEEQKRQMHNLEKVSHRTKLELDVQLKLAKQFGPAFEKMEEKAIKRFAPKL